MALQKDSCWMESKEHYHPYYIAQVTKLDRDPASGTALQEISFWLNLERALLKIQEKRESPEVALTLDILKHGKRFHATVSFDTDTGKLHVCSRPIIRCMIFASICFKNWTGFLRG